MTTTESGPRTWKALLAVATIAIAGCAGEPSVTTTAPPTTTTTEAGTGDAIPDQFPQPAEIEDFDTLIASSEDVHAQWEVGTSSTDTVAFYDQALPEHGWEILTRREGGDSTRYAIAGHGWEGAVTILGGEPVKVVLQLGSRSEDG